MIKNLHNSIRHKASVSKNYMQMKTLKQDDSYRIAKTDQMVNKLFEMGVINAR